jgi:hypothetical protein
MRDTHNTRHTTRIAHGLQATLPPKERQQKGAKQTKAGTDDAGTDDAGGSKASGSPKAPKTHDSQCKCKRTHMELATRVPSLDTVLHRRTSKGEHRCPHDESKPIPVLQPHRRGGGGTTTTKDAKALMHDGGAEAVGSRGCVAEVCTVQCSAVQGSGGATHRDHREARLRHVIHWVHQAIEGGVHRGWLWARLLGPRGGPEGTQTPNTSARAPTNTTTSATRTDTTCDLDYCAHNTSGGGWENKTVHATRNTEGQPRNTPPPPPLPNPHTQYLRGTTQNPLHGRHIIQNRGRLLRS